jgi:trigger factor
LRKIVLLVNERENFPHIQPSRRPQGSLVDSRVGKIGAKMKVEIQKVDKLKRVMNVLVVGEDFIKERNDIYTEIGKNLKVPGFRPGAAPLEILEKSHAKALKEEYLKQALPLYYERALKDNALLPASLPRIYDVELANDSLKFSAEFEVKPEIQVKDDDYKGIKIKDRKIEVEETEVEKVLTNMKDGVKKMINKDLNDQDLAKWAGYPAIADFRQAIKTEIYMEKLHERRRKIDSQVSEHLLKSIKVDLPQDEVERYHKELMEREIYNLRLRNIPEEDIEKYKKEVEDKLRPLAEDQVKIFYILEAIAAKEGIKAENNLGEVILGFLLSVAHYE